MTTTLDLCLNLLARPSLTPADEGCQKLITERLSAIGFHCESLQYEDVSNLWATHGSGNPVFSFLGHTDVVPTGPIEGWDSDPFQPEIRNGLLYGRGAADMKGSVAAMVTALERFITQYPDHKGTIALLLTSDEEGVAIHGVRRVMEVLKQRNVNITWCLVGEPSSEVKLGDVIRIGRRGSLGAVLHVYGTQGHVAFPEKASNPIHNTSTVLKDLCDRVWDQGNEHYPPTSFQITNIHAGTGADNVIPGKMEVWFNFRFSTETTEEKLKQHVHALLDHHGLKYTIDWRLSGQPFLTQSGDLLDAVRASIREYCNLETRLSTGGGTSDGRFVAPSGAEVIEFGPLNASIHKLNECIAVEDIGLLTKLYQSIVEKLCISDHARN